MKLDIIIQNVVQVEEYFLLVLIKYPLIHQYDAHSV